MRNAVQTSCQNVISWLQMSKETRFNVVSYYQLLAVEETKPLRCRSTLSSMTPSPFVPFYFFFSLWPSNTKLHFLSSSSSSPLFHFHFSTCWRWQAFNTLFLTWHKCGRRSSTSNRETHKVKCPQKLCRFLMYLFIYFRKSRFSKYR